jgi:hypothetical protein
MNPLTWIYRSVSIALALSVSATAALAQTPPAPPDAPTPADSLAAPSAPPMPPRPILTEITRTQFDQVNLGMTIAQVTQLLGQPDGGNQDWSQPQSGTASYQWRIVEGDRIAQVVFYNGRVVGRTTWALSQPTVTPEQTPETPKPKP